LRCPDCNKFVSFDTETEPEVQSEQVDENGAVEFSVRITNNCADCGTELTETTLEMEDTVPEELLADHKGDEHEYSVEVVSASRTERQSVPQKTSKKTSKTTVWYRGAKTYYGAEIEYSVKCSCGVTLHEGTISAEEQASYMESLV
jgi:uncharacterized protein with PIN domain